MKQGSTCIVNAASERDMAVFAAGMIKVKCPAIIMIFLFFHYNGFESYLQCFPKKLVHPLISHVELTGRIEGNAFPMSYCC